VKLLLERGADIETRDDGGKTPLSSAAFPGRVDVVQVLLDSGADIETRDDGGKTPVSLAAKHERADVVRLLLDCGAHMDTPVKKVCHPFCGLR